MKRKSKYYIRKKSITAEGNNKGIEKPKWQKTNRKITEVSLLLIINTLNINELNFSIKKQKLAEQI